MLEEAGDALREDRDKQGHQKGQRDADGDPAIGTEPLLARAPRRQACADARRRFLGADHAAAGLVHTDIVHTGLSHTALCISSRSEGP